LPTTIYTVAPDALVSDAASLMMSQGVGDVIVAENLRPLGILTDRDLVVRVLAAALDPGSTLVREVMTSPVVTITRNEDLAGAIALMDRHGIRRLPIVDEEGCLASILTLDDIQMLGLSAQPEIVGVIRRQLRPQQEAETVLAQPDAPPVDQPAPARGDHAGPSGPVYAQPVSAITRPSVVVPVGRVHHRRHHHRPRRIWVWETDGWLDRHRFWVQFFFVLLAGGLLVFMLLWMTGEVAR
jgi:CBS-domain-containing membrane protein